VSFFSSEALEFWKYPVLGCVLAAALCGFLGVYIVLRRVVFVGAALTQISGVGIAFALWLGAVVGHAPHHSDAHAHGFYLSPQLYSLVFAVAGALLFAFARREKRIATDTVVGLGWVIAAAALLLILSSQRIAKEAHEVDEVLYGSAVLAGKDEVLRLAFVVAAVLAIHLAFFKELVFVTYDGEMARTLGLRTELYDVVLYATFGVGISFAVRTVGALPAFGFVVIPAAAALLLVRRAVYAFPLAVGFAVFGGAFGYYLAWTHKYPTGAAIVAASTVCLAPGLLLRVVRRDS
jgi:zinc transport system permease protein